MKILEIVIALLFFTASATAQTNPQQPPAIKPTVQQQATTPGAEAPPASQSKVDPAKEADILRLLEVTGAKTSMLKVMDTMENNVRPIMTNSLPPGDYREKLINFFFEKFQLHLKSEVQGLLNAAVPIYDKYFSDEDIKGLIRFYETPLGQKATSELPKLMVEMQGQGMKMGEKIGQDSMMEVLSEHPELAKALEDAARAARPQSPDTR